MKKAFNKIILLSFLSTCIALNSYSVIAEDSSNYEKNDLSQSSQSSQTVVFDSDFPIGDLDGDGQVNSTDYALIKKYILGQIKNFPVEGKIISSISNFNDVTINQGDDYKLPGSVSATMKDGSQKDIPITWDVSSVDTSKIGTYTYIGTISGYSNKINLTINVIKSNTGENTVSEINPINLNQFEITFNTNVDEDTAELPSNYKVGGIQLHDTNAHAELVNDNTVRITLVRWEFSFNQGAKKTVSVKKGILTKDKTEIIETYDKVIEFKDITAPTLKNMSVIGNNKLIIEFSEAVNMSNVSALKSLVQINGNDLSNAVITVKGAASNGIETWASKVEIYLNSPLSPGENIIKIKDTDNGILADAIGFAFKEAEKTVTVDNVISKPVINSITCTDGGEIRIKFDRPMDIKTALNLDNYLINNKVIYGAEIELKENDTVVKIMNLPDGIFNYNENKLSVNSNVKDAYGNKVADNTELMFRKQKDETKPTILSATAIDSNTLRIRFSEDVRYAYATNKDNYQLINTNNIDLMNKSGVYIVAASANTADTDTYDIKFDGSAYKLDGSRYTLTVANIVDKATEPNKMDSQTITLEGKDDTAPNIDNLDVFMKSNTEVAIYFGEEMDPASLTNKANYYYVNGEGDSINLPSQVDITVSADNKGVVLDFEDANMIINPNGVYGDDVVRKIGIKTVKDSSGNELYGVAMAINLYSSCGPKLEENTFKLYKDGEDVKAGFILDTALDILNLRDFQVSGITPDSATLSGYTITLTFKDGAKADAVMALGTAAELIIKPSDYNPSVDIAGRTIKEAVQRVYYNNIAPETDRDNYSSVAIIDDATGEVTSAVVNITMKTPVDANIIGAYRDDFIFTNSTRGINLRVQSVELSGTGTTLSFKIDNVARDIRVGDRIDITAATDKDDIDIRTAEDGNGYHIRFVPTADDMKVKAVVVMGSPMETP